MDVLTEKIKLNAMGKYCKGEEYTKSYKVFLEKSQQHSRLGKNLRCYLPVAMEGVHITTDACRVLSIGSGDGEVDLKVLKVLKEVTKKRIFCRVIEPNEYSLNKYKTSIESLSPNDDMTFDINKPKTFQKYMTESLADQDQFDVVHFLHSIYYMDFEEALTHCYEKELGESGLIVCVFAADDIMFEAKQKLFGICQPNQSISQVVKQQGWKYQEYKDEYMLDVTEVMNDQSETGNLLLDFLTQTTNFRRSADHQMTKAILDVIDDLSIQKDGKLFCKKVDYYTFIFK
ncbi:histamine N-methyltransferase [Exaiptasia diaphana]|uniref:Histamine N-methyltransferase n=1 Tax=Exaiptasia diaphana TaxID=2652724 RepID=A0A913XQ31_EXADI|nr:histamine N-methyltransferase [Exaiptasia diaphana]KXJ09850.1 Histamine N-methyltransferase [Exaiptasia diaphana]